MGRRGRKKGADGEKRRRLLLQAAATEFALHGYHETKISMIVEKANVTQPSFYLYFQSKEAIFQELVDMFQQQLIMFIKQSLLEEGLEKHTLEGEITERITRIFTFFQEQPQLTRIGFYMANESKVIKNQIAILIEQNLLEEQRNGYFRSDTDMHTVAESLVGIIERLTKTRLLNGLSKPEKLANEIVRLLLYGLKNET
ncbi:TetR/AcrR family transcriptional regulator [Virgibacillus sp. 179-BFC.A HS]|uniref:TetR/AcrR family transcriptional regulator n=1 Tax=Tigheibacillus jepli TaxID=3035914 RepID=A0ABU5CD74_9BACI|nr:TetR/AcrR family transcriptional regulator [Virgibacillus sp. 179-BFC.A HS]MDY0404287.1 TetR/AcrR family transcriptional regulator [Virgibacillus sp. 179-BFC.A HS]